MASRRDLPDLRGLAALDAVLASGSVSAAATRLGWSHPTVDHHLAKLERLAGAPLLQRGPRGSTPTAAGRLLGQRAAEVLAASTHALDELATWLEERRRLVRFGIFPTLGAMIVPRILELLEDAADAEEGIRLEVTLDECERLIEQLGRGALDAAILFQGSGAPVSFEPGITAEVLFAEPVLVAVPRGHAIAARPSQPLTDLGALRDDRWSFGASGSDTLDDATRELARRSGFEPVVGMHSDDYPAILGMVSAGLIVAVVPASVATWGDDTVAFVPISASVLTREVLLATRGRLPEAARAAVDGALRAQRSWALSPREKSS